MSHPRKIYPIDPGFIPEFDGSLRMESCKALETVVGIDFLRRGATVNYVRTRDGFEVGSLARWPEGRAELIQVCAEADEAGTAACEVRALRAAAEEYPDAACSLVTLVPERFTPLPAQIRLYEASLWLLRPE